MLWVTYRQFRASLLGTLVVVALVAVVTAGVSLVLRNSSYAGMYGTFFSCFGVESTVCVAQTALTGTTLLTIALPSLIGLFVGVTVFSRDIERGTHVLSLSQSVGRVRWYFSRVLVVFVPIILAMLVHGLVFSWTRLPDSAGFWTISGGTGRSRFDYPIFETEALMPSAYTAVALMIGSTRALLLRHTIGAMVLTLIATVGLSVLVSTTVRQHYATPLVQSQPIGDLVQSGEFVSYGPASRWNIDQNYVDLDGNVVDIDYALCAKDESFWNEIQQRPEETYADWERRSDALNQEQIVRHNQCIERQGADRFEIEYFEDSSFWRFQNTEAALALLVSALACAGSLFLVRRLRP